MKSEQEPFHLLFDLDGTLIDSFSQIIEACKIIRTNHNYLILEPDVLISLIGLPAEALFADLVVPATVMNNLVQEFREELGRLIQIGNVDFPNALDFVALAKNEGCRISVATSKPLILAMQVIENSRFNGIVDYVAGTGDLRPKPHPDLLLSCIRESEFRSAIMFGDRPEDIAAALDSGIKAIGLAQGNFTEVELNEAGAVASFANFEHLYKEVTSHKRGLNDYLRELCR